jgi:hypothetical protein
MCPRRLKERWTLILTLNRRALHVAEHLPPGRRYLVICEHTLIAAGEVPSPLRNGLQKSLMTSREIKVLYEAN